MNVFTLLALAIAPGLAIALFIYWKDKFDKEPRKILLISFFLGVVSTIPAVVIESFGASFSLSTDSLPMTLIYTFVIVALTEESCKFFMLRIYAYRKKEFNEPFDGIIYSVMVAMGFATLENIMYVLQYGAGNAIIRMFTAVPAHATFGIIMGYYAGLARFNPKEEMKCLLTGVIYAALLHGAYDFFLLQNFIPGMTFGAIVSLFLGLRFSRKAIRLHQEGSPFRRDIS